MRLKPASSSVLALLGVSLLMPATSNAATAAEQGTDAELVGSWSCMTVKERQPLRITFRSDGTVAGRSGGRLMAGHYVVNNGFLSISTADQLIAAFGLQIGSRAATANLMNGDRIACTK
ncbi:MAG: hypothetical protein JOZ40_00745 [Methylobacteriaceae bacterium]|nr:hypothetical protein [Methylobacteriaceae bacterium]